MKVANRYCFFHGTRHEKVIKSDFGTDGVLHLWIHDGSASPIVEVAYDPHTDHGRVVARHQGLNPHHKVWPVEGELAPTPEWIDLAQGEIAENYLALV